MSCVNDWQCHACREKIPGTFAVCWSCGASQDGVENPAFQRHFAPARELAPEEVDQRQSLLSWFRVFLWWATCMAVLYLCMHKIAVWAVLVTILLLFSPLVFALVIYAACPKNEKERHACL